MASDDDEEVVKYIITNRDSLQLLLMHTSTLINYDTYGLLWLFFAVGFGVGGGGTESSVVDTFSANQKNQAA